MLALKKAVKRYFCFRFRETHTKERFGVENNEIVTATFHLLNLKVLRSILTCQLSSKLEFYYLK